MNLTRRGMFYGLQKLCNGRAGLCFFYFLCLFLSLFVVILFYFIVVEGAEFKFVKQIGAEPHVKILKQVRTYQWHANVWRWVLPLIS